ncbi:MAG: anthranilate synthase component I family protein [Acidobacteria bacterium]|nr:anthranilate synthase component I family protein [Acidobacteriota bacterium]
MFLDLTADDLIFAALRLSEKGRVAVLDSCGIRNLGSRSLIVGIEPVEVLEFSGAADDIPEKIEKAVSSSGLAAIVTLSYDLGQNLVMPPGRSTGNADTDEPQAYAALFDSLIVHDYVTGKTRIRGSTANANDTVKLLIENAAPIGVPEPPSAGASSNFSRKEYIDAILEIQEEIRKGNTYQTNLTQQFSLRLPKGTTARDVFLRLRRDHPAPFAAFVARGHSNVVSVSPERLVKVEERQVSASPIKGTRPRGKNAEDDMRLRNELLSSAKDRAENTMIVDLLRNDLGRICEFGSVHVEKLCDLEVHPTLFHLVSTITGTLRTEIGLAGLVRAVFPCGSITGAPKRSTMSIIDRIEPDPRGLSMGSIGIIVPKGFDDLSPMIDLNVAIRTMVEKNGNVTFNVGGGIVIDSVPELEYDESLLKAKALLAALGVRT